MGVRGLLSACLSRQDECTETVDLIEEARRQGGIELLVDFRSFEYYLLNKFWTGLSQLRGNAYLRIIGGEYSTLNIYVTKLIKDLKSCDISLVFYIDGAKGSSTETLRQKLGTWVKRHYGDLDKMTKVLDVLWGLASIQDLSEKTDIRPVVLEDELITALKHCGCEIHQSAAGEADMLLVRALRERPKAFAIVSNDSDFCVFMESRFIPEQLFDLENDLQLGQPVEVPEKPYQLKAKLITTERVMNMFKLNNHSLLVEMSIAAGNDFTGPFMLSGLGQKLDIYGRRTMENYAGWIKHYKNIQNHPALADQMYYDKRFRKAVYYSRDFYNLRGDPDRPPRKGYYSQLIKEGIRSGRLQNNLMSMHNNFYWYRLIVEDNQLGQPCCECALIPLREYIYRIILPRHENQVNEHGRSPYKTFRKAWIMAVDDGLAPRLHKIQPDKIFQNLRTFHAIMCHQERGNRTPNWFDRYGRKKGFTLYLLRYFLLLNWDHNLCLSDQEYLALVAMVMGKPDERYYQTICLKPTVRCVTILNWFQDLYRHAYSMLGSLLHCKHEFPLPSELFSGAMWAAMYMAWQDEIPMAVLKQEMNDIIWEKRHIIRDIVGGLFPFDDR